MLVLIKDDTSSIPLQVFLKIIPCYLFVLWIHIINFVLQYVHAIPLNVG